MSFMDSFSGYNQIKMYLEDEKHTVFQPQQHFPEPINAAFSRMQRGAMVGNCHVVFVGGGGGSSKGVLRRWRQIEDDGVVVID